VQRKSEGVAVHHVTQDEAHWTNLLFSGAPLAEVAPERDSAPFVAVLADHLANGRFAGWQQCGEERTAIATGAAATTPVTAVPGMFLRDRNQL